MFYEIFLSANHLYSARYHFCMTKTRLINVRLSKRQYDLLINRMECMGYRNMSQFIRDCALRSDLATIRLLQEIHERVVGSAP